MVKEYQPWNDSWKNSIAYVRLSPAEWTPVRQTMDLGYPIFTELVSDEEWPRLMNFWRSVVDTMIYILGHDLYHEAQQEYIRWLLAYDRHIPEDLLKKAKRRMDDRDPVAAVWMLQAAILLDPDQWETHYYLGLAYSQYALDLYNDGKKEESDLNFYQAVRYLVNTAELDPQSGKAYYALGFVFRRLGLDDESRKCLEKYIMLGLEDGTYRSRGAMPSLPDGMIPDSSYE